MPEFERLLFSPPPKRRTAGGEKRLFYREGIGFGTALVLESGEGRAVAQVAFNDVDLEWTQISMDIDEWDFSEEAARMLVGGAINVAIAQSRSRLKGAFEGAVSEGELARMLDSPCYRMTEPS